MKTALLGYKTKNIGDDLQSFSLLNISNTVDAIVDRDCLADAYLAGKHQLVLNTWFKLGNDNRSPATNIAPIFFGFALGDENILDTKLRDYLKAHEPIGCRDIWSAERLNEAGIDAYWTGCSSIFAGNFIVKPSSRTGIFNFDVPLEFLEKIAPASILKQIETTSNHVAPASQHDQLQRFSLVDRFLRLLASAELVITRRLHIALPCIGLGTPVIYLPDERLSFSRRRASGVDKMIPVYFQSDVEAGLAVNWEGQPPRSISEPILQHYERLKARLGRSGENGKKPEEIYGREFIRISNRRFGTRPGRIFLSLPGLDREVRIEYCCDKFIDTDVRYFSGIERLSLNVQHEKSNSFSRPTVGTLNTLMI
ncbi:polysaccharide pyruvyl transferase family protein [Rhizobium sp. OAE497]|uniref:polysaccharide pyruvyl transferase family protein n=1 Tax=Rhizobium sp. OAE497 TaxID=2663796 RepID=UPI0018F27B9B